MLKVFVAGVESGALQRRLREVKDAVDPRSRKMDRLRSELAKSAVKDNTEKLLGYGSSALAGVDRFGRDLAQPADSTVKSWRLKVGRVLAPEGLRSRTITNYRAKWILQGDQWRLILGWVGIPWMIYHLEGRPKGSHPRHPNWRLPKRDIGGMSPKGWAEWRATFDRFWKNLLRSSS
jgi:hypothetical protein